MEGLADRLADAGSLFCWWRFCGGSTELLSEPLMTTETPGAEAPVQTAAGADSATRISLSKIYLPCMAGRSIPAAAGTHEFTKTPQADSCKRSHFCGSEFPELSLR